MRCEGPRHNRFFRLQFGMTAKPLTSALTSYDLLKGAALLLMIIDHTGAFFYPDENWFRVIGRFSAPVWLFLVGYARSRDFSAPLWIGTVLIALNNFALGEPILPLCILATIMVCRAFIDPLMLSIARKPSLLYPATFIIFILSFLTFPLVEYGTSALLFVMIGYLVRNWETLPYTKSDLLQFVIISSGLYGMLQLFLFVGFSMAQNLVAGLGILLTGVLLTGFHPAVYEKVSNRMPKSVLWLLHLCGRRTLEIYVVHFILFKVAGAFMSGNTAQFLDFHIL